MLSDSLESFTFNVTAPATRHEIMSGKNYIAVPMVMLTEGVHAGSNGPLYYPANELSKTPAVWNHKPVVVYHPTMNGQAISACEPAVISRRCVGLIMNTKYEVGRNGQPGKLKAEAWLETNRLKEVDPRVVDALQSKSMMEVSTGLFTDNEQVNGQWKRKPYEAIARNYRPDHLAILPDEKGACSIADGAGLLRNSESSMFFLYSAGETTYKQPFTVEDGQPILNGVPEEVDNGATMTKKQIVNDLIANGEWAEDDREWLMNATPDQLSLITNKNPGQSVDSGSDDNDQLDEGKGAVAPKKMGSKSGATKNKGGDQDADKRLPKQTDEEAEDDEDDAKPGKPTRNSRVTVDEYINNAPAGIRDVLASSVKAHEAQKRRLIGQIVANKANPFTKEFLAQKPLEELQGLAALAARPSEQEDHRQPRMMTANYSGQADAGITMTDNAEEDSEVEPLVAPVMNFAKIERQK